VYGDFSATLYIAKAEMKEIPTLWKGALDEAITLEELCLALGKGKETKRQVVTVQASNSTKPTGRQSRTRYKTRCI
jgi:hypothetical protein